MGKSAFIIVSAFILCVLVSQSIAKDKKSTEDQLKEWKSKLVGKYLVADNAKDFDEKTQFRKSDLPKNSRILAPDTMTTMDYSADRLNVKIDKANKCTEVKFG